jgi:hypothetical protein
MARLCRHRPNGIEVGRRSPVTLQIDIADRREQRQPPAEHHQLAALRQRGPPIQQPDDVATVCPQGPEQLHGLSGGVGPAQPVRPLLQRIEGGRAGVGGFDPTNQLYRFQVVKVGRLDRRPIRVLVGLAGRERHTGCTSTAVGTETEIRLGPDTEDSSKRGAVVGIGPTDLPAFDLADMDLINGRVATPVLEDPVAD